jgi:hypothetical protein
MFPVGLPRSREAWAVSVMDKISAAAEYCKRAGAFAYSCCLLYAGR